MIVAGMTSILYCLFPTGTAFIFTRRSGTL